VRGPGWNVVILNEVKNLLLNVKPRPFASLRVTEMGERSG